MGSTGTTARKELQRTVTDAGRQPAIQRWVKLHGDRAWHRLVGRDDELRQHFIGPRDGRIGDRHGTLCGASGSIAALSPRVDRRSRCPSCIANDQA